MARLKLIPLLFLLSLSALAQVSVAPAPPVHMQFFTSTGKPLSGGLLYTYAAGTSTPQATYVDSTGLIQNANPIPLDSTGSPSNGSVQVGVYLANQSYKFIATNSFGAQQWTQDGVTGYLGLLNLPNTWSFPQTFTNTLTLTLVNNQMIFGVVGNQTTLDFPPPIGNVTLHFPNTADTIMGRATADTETNKTLTSPVINTPTVNGLALQGVPVQVIGKSTTVVPETGDTALHTVYTIPIPAGAMVATGQMRITLTMLVVVSAGNPTVTIKYGGTRISPPLSVSASTGGDTSLVLLGGNLGATNSQSWDMIETPLLGPPAGFGNVNHTTSAIDSTISQNLTVTYQGGANSDSITFYRVIVELL